MPKRYGDTDVYREGNSFSDAPPGPLGTRLATAIRSLAKPVHRRVTGRLMTPAEQRELIPAESAIAPRQAAGTASAGGGLVSPVDEQRYTGEDFHYLTSSDGVFVFESPAESDFIDAVGQPEKRRWFDYGSL